MAVVVVHASLSADRDLNKYNDPDPKEDNQSLRPGKFFEVFNEVFWIFTGLNRRGLFNPIYSGLYIAVFPEMLLCEMFM